MSGMNGMYAMQTLRSLRRDPSVKNARLTRDTLRRIIAFARPQRARIVLFLAFVVVDASLVIVQPLLVGRLIDDGILAGAGGVVTIIAATMVAVALLDAALSVITGVLSARIGENLIFDLRTRVFSHVQRMPLAFFTRTQTGALVSRLNNDVIGAQRAFTTTLAGTVSNVVSVLVVGVAAVSLSWQLTLLCLATLPILLAASRWVGTHISGLTRNQMDGNADLGHLMTERFNVGGALLLKLFGRREEEDARYADKAGVLREIGVRITFVTRVFAAVMMFVPALAVALVWGIGGHLAISSGMTIGTLTALATLLLRLIGPLQALSNVRIDVMTALVSFDRVFEVLDLPSTITDAPDAIDLPAEADRVEFDNVHFSYPATGSLASLESVTLPEVAESGEVLKGISFVAEPGQLIALVGPSGAGKTTLTHLVARLYDVTAGAVRIGTAPGAGMHDVRDVTTESLEAAVGYVTQDAHLFHDTIRENLRYARPEADDADLWRALEAAHVAEVVRRMPNGLDTVVGDRGYRVSGGERQRLAIARLLLKAPPLVILDEATAHLDSESEAAVQAALDTALQGRTAIVIAHRLSTIRDADQILVLDDGEIVERGSHEDLVGAGGLYSELHRTQFRAASTAAAPVAD